MKKIIFGVSLLLILAVSVAMSSSTAKTPDSDFTVHEWGTFTSVSSSNGELLDGLFLEEEELPGFVHSLYVPVIKGLKLRNVDFPRNDLKGVNIKMETPVIYFYSDKERDVDVSVSFQGGVMNQWYPQAVKGREGNVKSKNEPLTFFNDIDFRKLYNDRLEWKVKVLSPDSRLSYTSPQNLETPTWVNPRFVDANMLQIGKDREKFIFYRGLARFQQPFKVSARSETQLTLENTGSDEISFAMVYEYTKDKKAKVWWTGSLSAKEELTVDKKEMNVDEAIHTKFTDGLIKAGLYEKEAKSMLETWRHSYFEKEGLRVFWIVPRKFTDEILPLKLKPAPKKLERVLVGRTEVMTPEFEQELVHEFVNNSKADPFWFNKNLVFNSSGFYPQGRVYVDRFFKAWQFRVNQLLEGKTHKFSFLKQVSGEDLKLGEFYIKNPEKGFPHFRLRDLQNNWQILSYTEKNSLIDGEVTYDFASESVKILNEIQGFKTLDRRAVFTMKAGRLEGECKIYNIRDAQNPVLVATKVFKDGKEVH